MPDFKANDPANTDTKALIPSPEPVESSEESPPETSAQTRLRALEDQHLGDDVVRINGEPELGRGSRFQDLHPAHRALIEAVRHEVAAERKVATAKAHLAAAEDELIAAQKVVAAAEAESVAAATDAPKEESDGKEPVPVGGV